MEELQNKVKQILSEIEENIKDEKIAEYAKTKVFELYETFADELEKIEETCSNRIDVISAKYAVLETKMGQIETTIDKIEKDLYITDEEYDLDIVCPYCDAEFTIDTADELKNSVTCPECNNVIELDWNEEHECGHDCSKCHHDCDEEAENDQDDEDM